MKLRARIIAALACLQALLFPIPATADNSYLRPERIYAGDVTELVLEYDSKIPSLYALDTSRLERDFRLIEQNSRIIRVNDNGEIFHRMQWRFKLQPRRSGSLTVPALDIGERRSRALSLEVLPLAGELAAQQDVYVEVEADPAAPYVGQQTLLTTRLYYNTPIIESRLLEPKAADATIFNDSRRQPIRRHRAGQGYELSARTLALVPAVAGPMRIDPASYRGRISTTDNSLRQQRSIYRESNSLELDVRAPPREYQGEFWLPARQLALSRDWQLPQQPLEPGSAVDFTLTIEAIGIPAEVLPENLLVLDREDVKIYPDRAERSNEFSDGRLLGRLEQRYVVIPTRSGQVRIPGLALAWWNVASDHEMQARLEGRVLEILPPATAAAPATYTPSDGMQALLLRRDSLVVGLLLLGVLFAGWAARRFDLPRRAGNLLARAQRRRATWRELERACRSGDAPSARRLLLAWARLHWRDDELCGLRQVDRRSGDPRLGAELQRLDAVLYSPRQRAWQGRDLLRLLRSLRRRGRPGGRRAQADFLPDLYPG